MILLFDAGGVLIEQGPFPIDTAWLPGGKSIEHIKHEWLHMDVSRQFEAGKITDEEFASEMVQTLGLKVDAAGFLERFKAWPRAPFPGTLEWLKQLPDEHETAMLSNTNELHWRRIKDEMQMGEVLNHYFLSHKLGMVKPDREIFEEVLSLLNARAHEVVFFDDNMANTEAASRMGINARHVVGPEQLRSSVLDVMQGGITTTD